VRQGYEFATDLDTSYSTYITDKDTQLTGTRSAMRLDMPEASRPAIPLHRRRRRGFGWPIGYSRRWRPTANSYERESCPRRVRPEDLVPRAAPRARGKCVRRTRRRGSCVSMVSTIVLRVWQDGTRHPKRRPLPWAHSLADGGSGSV